MGIDVLRIRSLGLPDEIVTLGLADINRRARMSRGGGLARQREVLGALGGTQSHRLTPERGVSGWEPSTLHFTRSC